MIHTMQAMIGLVPSRRTARIVGVTAEGVSIRIINHAEFGSVWFYKTVFVPSDKPVRVNLLNEVWFTGVFARSSNDNPVMIQSFVRIP
jgi:hypothetical protein